MQDFELQDEVRSTWEVAMNITHLEHAVYALLIQGVFVLAFWRFAIATGATVGAAFAAGFFISREHAQREYKIGDPSHLMPWEAFDVWNWSTDAQLDMLVPVFVVTLVAILLHRAAKSVRAHD